jgi:hypothetical protein
MFTRKDDARSRHDDGTYRHISMLEGAIGLRQRQAHELFRYAGL